MNQIIKSNYFSDIRILSGIGNKTAESYSKLCGGSRLIDILLHLPHSIIDRQNMPSISDMQDGQIVTCIVQIVGHDLSSRNMTRKNPTKIKCKNQSGNLDLVFFSNYPEYLKKTLPLNSTRVISGKVEIFGDNIQIPHPHFVTTLDDFAEFPKIEPVYNLISGISNKQFCKTVKSVFNIANELPEWIDKNYFPIESLPTFKDALLKAHNPNSEYDLESNNLIIKRLAYDELLASQLALKLVRFHVNKPKGNTSKGNGKLTSALKKALPFSLTNGQEDIIKQISNDQESTKRMIRLLQGDVGSGKTVVALFAMLKVVEENKQAVLMAPTEILSRQHFKWIQEITAQMPIKVTLLIGGMTLKQKRLALEDFANGKTNIAIGTHALFQEKVAFNNLALAVIDEQHRFGVNQRNDLLNKGQNVDALLMSATPIPRTLMLANYGDMDCSSLTEKPKGRKEITTKAISVNKIDNVIDAMKRVINSENKIYWICPLVEESQELDLKAVIDRHEELSKIFGNNKVGLAHGQMKAVDRDKAMLDFRDSEVNLLVATTVIEVGVDVKDATIIIIEHAERFGLSQLHQLRGRVGRNNKQSSCILLYKNLGKTSKKRLEIMRSSNNGFYLAEQDFKLRGGGEILGTRQSGLPNLKIANFYQHQQLLRLASNDAKDIIEKDSLLKSKRGENLKTLLKLFGYSEHKNLTISL